MQGRGWQRHYYHFILDCVAYCPLIYDVWRDTINFQVPKFIFVYPLLFLIGTKCSLV